MWTQILFSVSVQLLIERAADGISGNSGSVLILAKWNNLAGIYRASKFSSEIISGFLIVFKTKLEDYFIEDMNIEQYVYWPLIVSSKKMSFLSKETSE